MSGDSLQKLSPTHEAIARWLLENPGSKRGAECAAAFNVTQSWLSTVIHSDAFQAYIRTLQDDANNLVIHDIPAKLRGVAALAIDGLAEAVETAMMSTDKIMHREFLKDTVDTTLEHLGYGPTKAPAPAAQFQQNNLFLGTVTPKALHEARSLLLTMENPAGLPAADQLPASIEGSSRQV